MKPEAIIKIYADGTAQFNCNPNASDVVQQCVALCLWVLTNNEAQALFASQDTAVADTLRAVLEISEDTN
jgi:hypothetical protein